MSRRTALLLFLLSPAWNAAAQINIAGEWRFTATSSLFGITSIATGRIQQLESSLSGTLSLEGTPCATVAPFTGTILGGSLTVNLNENGQTVTLTGSVTADGNLASGTYTAAAGGCTNGDRGTWSGRRFPVVNAGGVVNAASFIAQPVAAGSIASLFGQFLASSTQAASSLPLPLSLSAASVEVNGVAAPLFFVSGTQINFQLRWELLGLNQVTVRVVANGVASGSITVPLQAAGPGIFSMNAQGTGQGAIQISNTTLLAAPSVPGAQRPASRGEYITIYCTGLGEVNNRPASGAAAGTTPLSTTRNTPQVTIGGASALVSFSGLVPGFVGLYQVNAQVPSGSRTGSDVPVQLSIGGVTSNAVTIAVQ